MTKRIHIFGASGSGTTTLSKALVENLGITHYDTNNYFWLQTDPPFKTIHKQDERQKLLYSDPILVFLGTVFAKGLKNFL